MDLNFKPMPIILKACWISKHGKHGPSTTAHPKQNAFFLYPKLQLLLTG
jgi:hypothetical protein